jgi:hypothetical protein
MNGCCVREKRFANTAWGALFILFGVLLIVPGNQSALFWLGSGLILLGLNLVRALRKLPVSTFSITLGFLALVAGGFGALAPVLRLPRIEIPFFPAALLVVGLYLLIPGPNRPGAGSSG